MQLHTHARTNTRTHIHARCSSRLTAWTTHSTHHLKNGPKTHDPGSGKSFQLVGRPDIYSPINVTAKETDLSRFHELKSCSYLFPVKKCFQVDQQHIFSHRGDFERAELLQLHHERPFRATAYLVSRLRALRKSDKRGVKDFTS